MLSSFYRSHQRSAFQRRPRRVGQRRWRRGGELWELGLELENLGLNLGVALIGPLEDLVAALRSSGHGDCV